MKRGLRKSERKTSGKMGKRNQSLEFSEEEWLNPRQEAETKKRRKSREIKRKENRVG